MQKNFLPGSKAEKEKRRCLGPVFFFFVSFFAFFFSQKPGFCDEHRFLVERSPTPYISNHHPDENEQDRKIGREPCFVFFWGEGKGKVGY